PSQLAKAAVATGRDATALVVEGRFQHVNFILNPRPIPIDVLDVIPPLPPKLMEMAAQVLAFDEELPPVELELDAEDLSHLADGIDANRIMFPCRCSGIAAEGAIEFLDAGPPGPPDWALVGCSR